MKLFKKSSNRVMVEEVKKEEFNIIKNEVKPVKRMTQTKAIINHLENYGGITQRQANALYGCSRLSSIIYRLRYEYGMNIITEDVSVVDRYGFRKNVAKYILVKDD